MQTYYKCTLSLLRLNKVSKKNLLEINVKKTKIDKIHKKPYYL